MFRRHTRARGVRWNDAEVGQHPDGDSGDYPTGNAVT